MRILVKNVCSGTLVIIEDDMEASVCFGEISVVLMRGYQFSSMEEIVGLLNQMGLCHENDITFDEDGSLLGLIPESLCNELDLDMVDSSSPSCI